VTFRYPGSSGNLFEGMSLDLPKGLRTVVWGESGVGKSSLLLLCSGFLKPDAGSVTIKSESVGFVFQERGLYPWLSVLQNVTLPLCRKLGRCEKRDVAMNALRRLGMDGLADRRGGELSGGQERRVQIARLLASKASLWLLDEPFAGIDAKNREVCREAVLEIQRETAATLLLATHSQDDLNAVAEFVVVVERSNGFSKVRPFAPSRLEAAGVGGAL